MPKTTTIQQPSCPASKFLKVSNEKRIQCAAEEFGCGRKQINEKILEDELLVVDVVSHATMRVTIDLKRNWIVHSGCQDWEFRGQRDRILCKHIIGVLMKYDKFADAILKNFSEFKLLRYDPVPRSKKEEPLKVEYPKPSKEEILEEEEIENIKTRIMDVLGQRNFQIPYDELKSILGIDDEKLKRILSIMGTERLAILRGDMVIAPS